MNILYIIGNGLDLAQGMETSYPDFYKHLQRVNNKGELLKQLLKEINENWKLWSDMEEGLGDFTQNVKDSEDFIKLYKELNGHLKNYLMGQERDNSTAIKDTQKFISDFSDPFKYLTKADKRKLYDFRNGLNENEGEKYSVITFNYTNTIEKFLNIYRSWPSHSNLNIGGIIHVHGKLDVKDPTASVIIGLDNKTQIANNKFHNNDRVLDFLLKSRSNFAIGETREEEAEELISHANVVIIYGVSLGKTDEKWWKLIKSQMEGRSDFVVILNIYDDGFSNEFPQDRAQYIRDEMPKWLSRLDISVEEYEANFKDRFFLMINALLFRPDQTKPIVLESIKQH